jgi:hypothetical protein
VKIRSEGIFVNSFRDMLEKSNRLEDGVLFFTVDAAMIEPLKESTKVFFSLKKRLSRPVKAVY